MQEQPDLVVVQTKLTTRHQRSGDAISRRRQQLQLFDPQNIEAGNDTNSDTRAGGGQSAGSDALVHNNGFDLDVATFSPNFASDVDIGLHSGLHSGLEGQHRPAEPSASTHEDWEPSTSYGSWHAPVSQRTPSKQLSKFALQQQLNRRLQHLSNEDSSSQAHLVPPAAPPPPPQQGGPRDSPSGSDQRLGTSSRGVVQQHNNVLPLPMQRVGHDPGKVAANNAPDHMLQSSQAAGTVEDEVCAASAHPRVSDALPLDESPEQPPAQQQQQQPGPVLGQQSAKRSAARRKGRPQRGLPDAQQLAAQPLELQQLSEEQEARQRQERLQRAKQINGHIQASGSWRALQQLLQEHKADLNHVNVATMLTHLANLQQVSPVAPEDVAPYQRLVRTLLELCEHKLRYMGPVEICSVLSSVHKLGIRLDKRSRPWAVRFLTQV